MPAPPADARPSAPAPRRGRRRWTPSAGRRRRALRRGCELAPREPGRVAEPAPEHGVARVDEDLLAGLGVLQHDDARPRAARPRADPRAGSRRPRGVARAAPATLPAGLADEVGDDEHQRAALDRVHRRAHEAGEIGRGAGACRGVAAGRGRCAAPGCARCAARSCARRRCCRGSLRPGCRRG